MRRIPVVVIALVVSAATWPAVAMAAPPALSVSPTSVAAGGSVTLTGSCEPNSPGTAISTAFLHDAAHDFAGVGAAPFTSDANGSFSATAAIPTSVRPGTYPITARCGGGNLGVGATLTVTGGGLPFTGSRVPPLALAALLCGAAGTFLILATGVRRSARPAR